MKYRLKKFVEILSACAVLAAAGQVASFFGKTASPPGAERDIGGKAAVFAVFGGYRAAIADFVWLKAYLAWEKRDYGKCLSNIELSVDIDPANIAFWSLGANIIAYDTPHWLFDGRAASPAVEKSIRRRQARLALDFLDRGIAANPQSRRLKLDKALVYSFALGDKQSALRCHLAACDAGAPIYVVRDCANMLEECGRSEEA